MKILIIRFSSIGDIILTSPVVRTIKKQKPGAEIHFLTKRSFHAVVEHNPYIDKIFYLNDDLDNVIEELKGENYKVIIDLHKNIRTLKVKNSLNVKKIYSFNKLNIRKWLLVNTPFNPMPDKSIVDRYFEGIEELGVFNDGKGLDYFISTNEQITNDDIPVSHWMGYVACVIGGSMPTKKLPVEQWKKFCELVPYPVILLGGPEDRDMGNAINVQDNVKIYNACGKFSLNESASLIQRAKVVVSNDTGLMHMAAAYQKPIISFWGNTSPGMGMFPYYGYNTAFKKPSPVSVLMENTKLSCHPCSKIGYSQCPKKHFKCMRDLSMEEAVKHVIFFWADK